VQRVECGMGWDGMDTSLEKFIYIYIYMMEEDEIRYDIQTCLARLVAQFRPGSYHSLSHAYGNVEVFLRVYVCVYRKYL
jgi:hypothetical protein